jgi:predicted RNA-binding Zn-ribbon protein involved in translation (DUF1610 family)
MRIVDARWDPEVNRLRVLCACGYLFEQRADRWRLTCPNCGRRALLGDLRRRYYRDARRLHDAADEVFPFS